MLFVYVTWRNSFFLSFLIASLCVSAAKTLRNSLFVYRNSERKQIYNFFSSVRTKKKTTNFRYQLIKIVNKKYES